MRFRNPMMDIQRRIQAAKLRGVEAPVESTGRWLNYTGQSYRGVGAEPAPAPAISAGMKGLLVGIGILIVFRYVIAPRKS